MSSKRQHASRTLAIVLTWVDIKNAEYEVVQRIRRAARNIGVETIIVDNDGYKVWSSTEGKIGANVRITQDDCDFVISLHFESPKLYDIFSYAALWNPPDFFVGPGYVRTTLSLASHDAALSCHSTTADDHARNIFAGFGRPLEETLPTLFHSVPDFHFEPSVSETSRLFYVGINWERITGERGRHHDLLELLDAEDLIDIYGPKVFLNAEPWRGFKCYRDEIPFDGESVVKRVHSSGICLALSSKSHQKSGIMSNRLFEGLAAGAVIVANPHPFIDRYFADCVYIIDDTQAPQALADQVRDLVLAIRKDPASARARALTAQRRFREMFTLERCLTDVIAQHDQRIAQLNDRNNVASSEVTVIVEYTGLEFSILMGMIDLVSRQKRCRIDLIIVCDKRLEERFTQDLRRKKLGFYRSVRIYSDDLSSVGEQFDIEPQRRNRTGPSMFRALSDIQTPFFCFIHPDDLWFHDHVVSLAEVLEASPESSFACSGKIVEDMQIDEIAKRHLEELRFDRLADMVHCSLPREIGRFLYRTSLLDNMSKPLVSLLDSFHSRYLNVEALLRGSLVQTCRATYVHLRWQMEHIDLVYPEVEQASFVLDAYRGDKRWIERSAELRPATETTNSLALAKTPKEIGFIYELSLNSEGLSLLRGGFSSPENGAVWIDGRYARLEFLMDGPVGGHDLYLLAGGRMSKDGIPQTVSVMINGRSCGTHTVSSVPRDMWFPIPDTVNPAARRISVSVTLHHAEQVMNETGDIVLDPRHLGLYIIAVGIVPHEDAPEDQIELPTQLERAANSDGFVEQALRKLPTEIGVLQELSIGSDGLSLLRGGFSSPENEFVWVNGRYARLEFLVDAPVGGCDLFLLAGGRTSGDGAPQSISVAVNGLRCGNQMVGEALQDLRFPIPRSLSSTARRISVSLTLHHAEPVTNEAGDILDHRHLGLYVAAVGILPHEDLVVIDDAGAILDTGDAFSHSVETSFQSRAFVNPAVDLLDR